MHIAVAAAVAVTIAACADPSDDVTADEPGALVGGTGSGDGVRIGAPVEVFADHGGTQLDPVIAWSGTQGLVVWRGPDQTLWSRRVGDDGRPLAPAAAVARGAGPPVPDRVLAWRGGWLVSWFDPGSGPTYRSLAAEVTASGEVGPAVVLAEEPEPFGRDLVVQGERVIVAWTHELATPAFEVRLAVLDRLESPVTSVSLDPSGLASNARLAVSDDGGALVVWHSARGRDRFTLASRLSADGRPVDGSGIVLSERLDVVAVTTVPGGGYLVSVADIARTVGADGALGVPHPLGLLPRELTVGARDVLAVTNGDAVQGTIGSWRLQRLTLGGQSRGPATTVAPYDARPSLAFVGDGRALLAHAAASPGGGDTRIVVRTIEIVPLGAACGSDAECVSGYCVDGVCCGEACAEGCDACAVGAGGALDGTCTARAAGSPCRAADGDCDVADTCDGHGTACPDRRAEAGTPCEGGVCGPNACEEVPETAPEAVDAGVDAAPADPGVDARPAEPMTDAGSAPVAGTDDDGGCGCRSGRGGAPLAVALALLGLLRRRPGSRAV
jgi:hypothetical protein